MARAWNVKPKNAEQGRALDALLNPEIDLVILSGIAGSGKTLLALAAGLEQVLESKMYNDIIFTRAPVSVGDDLGFLPGTVDEKMLPWAGALIDNLEMLIGNDKLTETVLKTKIKILAMQHMRGRSLNRRYVIIDETQNISKEQIKVLLTRAGEDAKIVCIGDATQVDNKKLSAQNNALQYLTERALHSKVDFIRHICLPDGIRSRLCSWASECL